MTWPHLITANYARLHGRLILLTMMFLLPTEFWACTLSWAFSVVRGVSWWMFSAAAVKSAGRSQTFTVQSRLPETTKEAFILNKRTQVEVYFSVDLEDVALGYWNTSCDTWSRRWSPQHWCGWHPGPHSAHGRCPCATHRLTCPVSKEATHLVNLQNICWHMELKLD